MQLFYLPGACSLAPHIVLEWIAAATGETFSLFRVERGTTRSPEYLRVNPLGKVPALLVKPELLLVEAAAILLYLAEQYPALDLGYGDRPKYELHRWLSHFTGNVHPAFFPFFAPQRYSSNPDWHQVLREHAFGVIGEQLEFLNTHMSDRAHMLADRRTILDPYLFVFLRWSKSLPKSVQEYEHLHRFYREFAQDPGVQRALTEQKIEA
ncbi:MAG: glutathione S-transferase N-terminal domain-containing protein [Pseudanabaenaceae cyanobacterium bins.68]|nr:glutathione S-transferase N-terminal domain-containing protein [Pseudanabaenaceae cyanobacterium bins.68]